MKFIRLTDGVDGSVTIVNVDDIAAVCTREDFSQPIKEKYTEKVERKTLLFSFNIEEERERVVGYKNVTCVELRCNGVLHVSESASEIWEMLNEAD